jgi:predicted DNA-binding protein (UPF0251 family)
MAQYPYKNSKVVLTAVQEQEAIRLRQVGSNMTEIADRLMVSRATLYNILDRNPKFADSLVKAKAGFKTSLRSKLAELALAGDTKILIHLSRSVLKNVESQKIEATVDIGNLSDIELEEAVKKILDKPDSGLE